MDCPVLEKSVMILLLVLLLLLDPVHWMMTTQQNPLVSPKVAARVNGFQILFMTTKDDDDDGRTISCTTHIHTNEGHNAEEGVSS